MRPEGLGNLIKIIHLIGSRTRDLQVSDYIHNIKIIEEGTSPSLSEGTNLPLIRKEKHHQERLVLLCLDKAGYHKSTSLM
jgi:hypothetical protein